MNVESILKEKGTEVATISPEATIKIGADWLATRKERRCCGGQVVGQCLRHSMYPCWQNAGVFHANTDHLPELQARRQGNSRGLTSISVAV
jgi:hypothetical protein